MIALRGHLLLPDGTVTLTLHVDALPEPAHVVFSDVGGQLVDHGDDGIDVTWTWGPAMVPTDPVQVCALHLQDALARWASRWSGGPIDLS